jgi:integrase
VLEAVSAILKPKGHGAPLTFNRILDKNNLKLDRDGNPRTAYSLRHTYICLRLMEGADIYQIAKNCCTSVEMIEKFYAAHIKNTLDATAIDLSPNFPPLKSRVRGCRHAHRDDVSLFG